jgi:hypothetical protein
MPPELPPLLATLRAAMPELRARYGVRSLALFGSRVRGDGSTDSDLDVLVDFEPDARPSLFSLVRLEDQIAALVGTRVDLVTTTTLRPRIAERILSELVPV